MPPSTTCSHTTSAAPTPVCGRASTEFSIFTASAGWAGTVPLSRPVSGQYTGGGGGGVDDAGGVTVAATAASELPAQEAVPVSATPASSAAPIRRRARSRPVGRERARTSVRRAAEEGRATAVLLLGEGGDHPADGRRRR